MAPETSVQPSSVAVDTPDGPVTQASIESLEEVVARNQQIAQDLGNQIAQIEGSIQQIQAHAGSILSQHQSEWASTDRAARIEVTRGMEGIVASIQEQIAQLGSKPHQGLRGFVSNLKDQRDLASLNARLRSAQAELVARYVAVADQVAPTTGVTAADALLQQIEDELARSRDLVARQKTLMELTNQLTAEISRRKTAISNLGFDAPAVEADLIANGVRPVATSLVLKRDEIAAVSVTATLCRYRTRTQYVGGSQGVSIPLGHGLRYRISSFRGQPIQTELLANVDQGTLVVTNQRFVFLGGKRDVSIPLAKLLQFEAFSNALAVGREGKETRDIFLVAHPAYVALYLQWVVTHQS